MVAYNPLLLPVLFALTMLVGLVLGYLWARFVLGGRGRLQPGGEGFRLTVTLSRAGAESLLRQARAAVKQGRTALVFPAWMSHPAALATELENVLTAPANHAGVSPPFTAARRPGSAPARRTASALCGDEPDIPD
jgi:hypothetical protein